jgi:hypothetical protein
MLYRRRACYDDQHSPAGERHVLRLVVGWGAESVGLPNIKLVSEPTALTPVFFLMKLSVLVAPPWEWCK